MIQKNWQELIKPKKLEIAPGDEPKRMATLVAEPLERGFGMTLGNALRRVLLSSLQGAAVTAVQIDGVLHEFSSIAGVREDVDRHRPQHQGNRPAHARRGPQAHDRCASRARARSRPATSRPSATSRSSTATT